MCLQSAILLLFDVQVRVRGRWYQLERMSSLHSGLCQTQHSSFIIIFLSSKASSQSIPTPPRHMSHEWVVWFFSVELCTLIFCAPTFTPALAGLVYWWRETYASKGIRQFSSCVCTNILSSSVYNISAYTSTKHPAPSNGVIGAGLARTADSYKYIYMYKYT